MKIGSLDCYVGDKGGDEQRVGALVRKVEIHRLSSWTRGGTSSVTL